MNSEQVNINKDIQNNEDKLNLSLTEKIPTESPLGITVNQELLSEIPIVTPIQDRIKASINSKPICRICFGPGSSEKLISPCDCKGSIGFVHKNCLEHWLGTRNVDKCELCQYHYATFRTQKRLWDWCIDPSTRTDRKNFLGDVLCFLFLTPLGVASFYLCVRGAYYFYEFEKGVLEATSLIGLAAFLAFAYSTWIVLSAKYHYAAWKSWRMRSWNIRLLVPDDSEVSIRISEHCPSHENSNHPTALRRQTITKISQRMKLSKNDNQIVVQPPKVNIVFVSAGNDSET